MASARERVMRVSVLLVAAMILVGINQTAQAAGCDAKCRAEYGEPGKWGANMRAQCRQVCKAKASTAIGRSAMGAKR